MPVGEHADDEAVSIRCVRHGQDQNEREEPVEYQCAPGCAELLVIVAEEGVEGDDALAGDALFDF